MIRKKFILVGLMALLFLSTTVRSQTKSDIIDDEIDLFYNQFVLGHITISCPLEVKIGAKYNVKVELFLYKGIYVKALILRFPYNDEMVLLENMEFIVPGNHPIAELTIETEKSSSEKTIPSHINNYSVELIWSPLDSREDIQWLYSSRPLFFRDVTYEELMQSNGERARRIFELTNELSITRTLLYIFMGATVILGLTLVILLLKHRHT